MSYRMRVLTKVIVVIVAMIPVAGWAEEEIATPQSKTELDFNALERVLKYKQKKEDAVQFAGFATMSWRIGKLDAAENLYKASIQLYREIGDKAGVVQQLRNLAALYRAKGDNLLAKEQDELADSIEGKK
jgi:hypothetical protein